MWEVQVHDDGDTEIRKVPASYDNQGTNLIFKDSDSLIAELKSYGIEDDAAIEDAMQRAEGNEYQWEAV
jgi:hypothetical protein